MNKDLFDKGLRIRKEVVGADYVERSLAAADEFNQPLQELITEYCWGEIWSREGIDRKTRSVLNIGMLIALNRGKELKLHIRGALNNGLSKDEIRELLLQATIYCGVPAGLEAFHVAKEAFAEYEENN